jgi:hypothetical protein
MSGFAYKLINSITYYQYMSDVVYANTLILICIKVFRGVVNEGHSG